MTDRLMVPPTADELAMWKHMSWATAVTMYAARTKVDVRDEAQRELVKGVFRDAIAAEVSHV
jgi:hypothetical protein